MAGSCCHLQLVLPDVHGSFDSGSKGQTALSALRRSDDQPWLRSCQRHRLARRIHSRRHPRSTFHFAPSSRTTMTELLRQRTSKIRVELFDCGRIARPPRRELSKPLKMQTTITLLSASTMRCPPDQGQVRVNAKPRTETNRRRTITQPDAIH